jgi:hypothetical protein
MKRVRSELIDTFLREVQAGRITATSEQARREMIFWERLSGTKWAAIETAANEWLSLQGRPEVSPATLHRIYKEAGNRDLERKLRRFLKESGSDLSLFRELNAGFYI